MRLRQLPRDVVVADRLGVAAWAVERVRDVRVVDVDDVVDDVFAVVVVVFGLALVALDTSADAANQPVITRTPAAPAAPVTRRAVRAG